ncbi:hypothetical protein Bbelb_157620 [Branchiostoma belcheri]|nr:hypothetical protein Bbelb_157620 [Branchiostoma belcheri]
MEGCGKGRPRDQMELKFAKRWEPPMKPGPCGNPQLHQIKRRVNRGTPVSMTGESGETASGEDPNCRSFHGCRPTGDSAFCGARSGAVGLPSSLLSRHSCAGLYLTAPHTPSGASLIKQQKNSPHTDQRKTREEPRRGACSAETNSISGRLRLELDLSPSGSQANNNIRVNQTFLDAIVPVQNGKGAGTVTNPHNKTSLPPDARSGTRVNPR